MKTTLNEIKKHDLHSKGWERLLASLGKKEPDDEQIDLMDILQSNGLKDAIWALCCFECQEYCLFSADVAEIVSGFYSEDLDDSPSKKAVIAIRNNTGDITRATATVTAAYNDYVDADDKSAAKTLDIANKAYKVAYATGDQKADAAATANYDKVFIPIINKRNEIKQLFINHFGAKTPLATADAAP